MSLARHDQQVLGYLSRVLSMELSAVQQYSTQARLVATWGLNEAADSLQSEAYEEFQHVNRIIDRMLEIGVAPNSSQLRPVKLAADLFGLLQLDRQLETDIIRFHHFAIRQCDRVGDYASREFFEKLLQEEQQHQAELAIWINRLGQAA